MLLPPRDDALSEVVGFVLLLAVIVVALSLYQVYGVPAAGRENEIAHMNQVKDRFVDYKISLDSLWVNNRSGVLLSTAFDLGTGAPATGGGGFVLPILTPAGSGGTVTAKSGGANLTIEPAGKPPVTIPLGSLSYQSSNNYWVDQTWTYQGGAVFLSQEGGTTVRVGPSIAVARAGENTTLTIAPISLEGSDMIAGSGPVRVETRMRWGNSSSVEAYDWVNLTIEADNPMTARAWERAFGEVRQRAIKEEGVDPSWLSARLNGNTAWLTIEPKDDRKVFLSMYPANYTVTIHNAASLMK
jgi:hypothetical protein